MKTIDNLLADIVRLGVGKLDNSVPLRDKKILVSLDKQINFGNFLTKNQGDLLIKIIKENENSFKKFLGDALEHIDTPLWSRPFRVINPVRKIYRKKDSLFYFVVEFTWNKRLQQVMIDLNKEIQGATVSASNKIFTIPLTEKNLLQVVNKLLPLKFEISEEIEKFYYEIKEIVDTKTSPQELDLHSNVLIHKKYRSDVGEENLKSELLNLDRQIRYQYQFLPKNLPNSLIEKIAARRQSKIWIKENSYTLSEIIKSIDQLIRFPLLVIVNGHDSIDALDNVKKLKIALEQNQIHIRPSVYFRFDNTGENNIKFNTYINENQLNNRLSEDTKIVVLANNKLPKFILQSSWYPKSVISFTNNFRTNKTSVWCDAVDLQIYYNDKQPIIGGTDAIL